MPPSHFIRGRVSGTGSLAAAPLPPPDKLAFSSDEGTKGDVLKETNTNSLKEKKGKHRRQIMKIRNFQVNT